MVKTLEVFMRTLVRDPDRLFSLIGANVNCDGTSINLCVVALAVVV